MKDGKEKDKVFRRAWLMIVDDDHYRFGAQANSEIISAMHHKAVKSSSAGWMRSLITGLSDHLD